MSCPLTASGPVPTTLSQKARPEGATVSSHGGALAAAMASGCKRTSRKQKEKPKPSASLLPRRVGFTFCWRTGAEELLLCWGRLEKLMFDASVEPIFFLGNFVLNFLGFTIPTENASELISTPAPTSSLKETKTG